MVAIEVIIVFRFVLSWGSNQIISTDEQKEIIMPIELNGILVSDLEVRLPENSK